MIWNNINEQNLCRVVSRFTINIDFVVKFQYEPIGSWLMAVHCSSTCAISYRRFRRRLRRVISLVSSSLPSFLTSVAPLLDKTSRRRLIDHFESVANLRETVPTTCRLIVATLIRWRWYKALMPIHLLFAKVHLRITVSWCTFLEDFKIGGNFYISRRQFMQRSYYLISCTLQFSFNPRKIFAFNKWTV